MNVKLTLKMDKTIIEEVKEFSAAHDISVSKLVEQFFRTITKEKNHPTKQPVSGIVAELLGIIPQNTAKEYRTEYTDYLTKKYQ
ncbi:MAG: hypothetical protein HYV32_06540 [Candidatus Kerfeldbacteria bacterium]|nr:hypothetical protein [Candidatus Kerfeldbacteria bacterium]